VALSYRPNPGSITDRGLDLRGFPPLSHAQHALHRDRGRGRSVRFSNPEKVFFPAPGETELDLARYYLAVADGALRGVYERPTVLKRFPDGATGEPFFQKRVPEKRPEWLQTARVTFPSGRSADELCPVDAAHLIWAVNLGCLDLNPWAVRRGDGACSARDARQRRAAANWSWWSIHQRRRRS
jgi:LigD, primase-polymerase domain